MTFRGLIKLLQQALQLNVNDRSPMTQLRVQITVSVFRLNYAFRLTVEGPIDGDGVHFLRRFLYELPFRCYKAFKSPTLFSKFR